MAKLSRRNMVIGGTALAGVAAIASRPGDNSGPRADYFLQLQSALVKAGIASPTLVIDKDRLNANIDVLKGHLPQGMGYRIVTKSLPSSGLISHIRARTKTSLLMTFNLPMLIEQSQTMPEDDQLLGKPLPVAAAREYLETVHDCSAAGNVQWLIDTPERLAQYQALASEMNMPLRISLEIDVGFHRGGFTTQPAIAEALKLIDADPNLHFSGLMGYEAHVSEHPEILGLRKRALAGAWDAYRAARATVKETLGQAALDGAALNAAGSPTYRNYTSTDIANELSVGSALVKPAKFDLDALQPYAEASFIAAPVLKSYQKTELPLTGLEFVNSVQQTWNPNAVKAVFIHGGHWLAKPVDPPGLESNGIWGHSSNQEMLNAGRHLDLKPDDFAFFRPEQSEAVFLQFGDIAVYEGGKISGFWPVYKASA